MPRRNVDIVIQPSGDVQVDETWQVRFSGGPFTFAFRGITLDKVLAVQDFQVSESGRPYGPSSSGAQNTFQVYQDSGQQFVKWFFPPTSNQDRTFDVRYTLKGALRIYDGGDQVWWKIGGQMHSLDQATGSAFRGLDSMTSGLFSMLDSTASVFTSAPQSSGGGGGGWSGGGGGGSSGFG